MKSYLEPWIKKTLNDFFYHHPHNLNRIINEPNHVEVWEDLFKHVFGSDPVDPPLDESSPLTRPRAGSLDPRWETFLLSKAGRPDGMGFMRAMKEFIEGYTSGTIVIVPTQEAA